MDYLTLWKTIIPLLQTGTKDEIGRLIEPDLDVLRFALGTCERATQYTFDRTPKVMTGMHDIGLRRPDLCGKDFHLPGPVAIETPFSVTTLVDVNAVGEGVQATRFAAEFQQLSLDAAKVLHGGDEAELLGIELNCPDGVIVCQFGLVRGFTGIGIHGTAPRGSVRMIGEFHISPERIHRMRIFDPELLEDVSPLTEPPKFVEPELGVKLEPSAEERFLGNVAISYALLAHEYDRLEHSNH